MPYLDAPHDQFFKLVTEGLLRQSTAVSVDGRGLLIEGPPGSGKSSLALALVDRGATLIGDDGIALLVKSGELFASPAPQTAGLIEIRNLGLIERPYVNAPVALIVEFSADAPRYVEEAGTVEIEGYIIPHLLLSLVSAPDPIKAEIALQKYGLAAVGQPER